MTQSSDNHGREQHRIALRADAVEVAKLFEVADDRIRHDLAEVEVWLEARHGARFEVQAVRHVSQHLEDFCGVVALGLGNVSARMARDEAIIALRGLGHVFESRPQADRCHVYASYVGDFSAHEKVAAILRISEAFNAEQARAGGPP